MKKFLALVFVLMTLNVLAAETLKVQTPPIFSQTTKRVVICDSYDVINGWTGTDTEEKMKFTTYINSNTSLSQAQVSGAYVSDVREMEADKNYSPRNPKYNNYNRFSTLEDAWCWFSPLLPKDIETLSSGSKFVGYIHMICEEGRNQRSIGMSCSIN